MTYPKYYDIGISFATSFITAGIITIIYHWLLITDISNLVAKNIIFNEEFLVNIFSKDQIDNLLKLLLEINLKKGMGTIVKTQIIDKIAKDSNRF